MKKSLPGLDGLGSRWAPTVALAGVELDRRSNHRRYGTISRYRVTTDNGLEREIIHGQSSARRAGGPVHLTVGTAPPLSLGPEGLVMHFLLKSMEAGLDGIVFGPERSPNGVDDPDEIRARAAQVSFARTAHVSHLICDHLADATSTDLEHMLWTGVSLGAMKGITFSAFAPLRGRRMVYAQFVVPACPYPEAPPTEADLKRFNRAEFGALVRLSTELLAHDMRSRMFNLNQNVMRAMRPGLMMRYAQSMPRDSVSNIFTEAWRDQVVTGDAGVAATRLPADALATFEIFDNDEAGSVHDWERRLGGQLGESIRLVVKRGRHTDAMRISNQSDRARHIGRVLRQIRDGVPLDELSHPYARD